MTDSTPDMSSLPRACIHLERLRKNVSLVHWRVPACMVHGRVAPVIGKLSMAQCIIDVSEIPEAEAGSQVLLAGEKMNMHRQALSMGRGTWELFLPLLDKADKTYI